jgi:hypothetical protein
MSDQPHHYSPDHLINYTIVYSFISQAL